MGMFQYAKTVYRFPFRRHIRRARARYRLHRMEWDGRYRSLEPPKGYEHYYSLEEMFPGFKDEPKPSKNFAEWRKRMHLAWRFYLYQYFPDRDPEMAELERRLFPLQNKKKEDKKVEEEVDQFVDGVGKKVKQVEKEAIKVADNVKKGWDENRPEAELFLKDRAEIMKVAVSEFTEGYHEVVSGKFKFSDLKIPSINEDEDDFKVPEADNLPLRYECVSETQKGRKEKQVYSTTGNIK